MTRAKRGMNARRVYSSPTDRNTGVMCDQHIALNGFYVKHDYPAHLLRIKYKDAISGKTLVFLINDISLPHLTVAALYKMLLASRAVFQVDQAKLADQPIFSDQRERS